MKIFYNSKDGGIGSHMKESFQTRGPIWYMNCYGRM